MLIARLGLIDLGAILPGMPPPSVFEQWQKMTDAADIGLSGVSPSVFGAAGIEVSGIIIAISTV
jgi:hypothetical protein